MPAPHRPWFIRLSLPAIIAVILTPCPGLNRVLHAQFQAQDNHPELSWQVIETDHFKTYYDQTLDGVARRAAIIAEEAYGPITGFYHFAPPEKVRIIIRDTDDFANGAAIYYQNTIEIWATNLAQDFELRGTSDWLRNVIVHEFVHIVSLQTAQKAPRRIPAFYLHFLGYQHEKNRKDVLQGYPDVITSYAVPSVIIPPWFAEGTAQYQAIGSRYDRWDSHRDMILRMAALNDRLLTYEEMCVFEKDGLGNEKVYDHGYSLTLFIARRFGEDKLEKITRGMSSWWRFSFSSATKHALGISGKELHGMWKADLEARYRAVADSVNADRVDGKVLRSDGYLNMNPRWSRDGERLVYLSNQGGDYGKMSLFLMKGEQGEDEELAGGGVTAADWSPDGKSLIYSRRSKPDRNGCRFWDLYELTPGKRGEGPRRLTFGLRAAYPSVSPDGKRIAFVRNGRGNANLCVSGSDGTGVRQLTDFRDGGQVYAPRWSPDGRRIAFSFSHADQRDIGVVSSERDTGSISSPAADESDEMVIASAGTDRDPCWTPDGKRLMFSSDVSGIFNLYTVDLEDGSAWQVTNVVGGAICPDVNPADGRPAFAHYGKAGYEIRVLPSARPWRAVQAGLFRRSRGGLPDEIASARDRETDVSPEAGLRPVASLKPGAIRKGGGFSSRPYRSEFSTLTLLPRFSVDDRVVKVGAFVGSDDVLGKQSLFAGFLMGRNFDQDLFGIFELRRWRPTFFIEFYRQVRHDDDQIVNRDEDFRLYERIFSLNEVGAGLRRTVRGGTASGSLIYSRYNTTIDQSSFNRIDLPRGRVTANYLSGVDLAFSYHLNSVSRTRDMDINPRGGREVLLRYDRYFNYFLNGFRNDASIVQEVYDRYFYDQLAAEWTEYFPLAGRTSLGVRAFGGVIDRRIDPFFDFRIGGLPGMKGYTFYSLEGRRAAYLNVTYRFPILGRIGRQAGPFYVDKLYGAVYADLGRAWDGDAMDDVLRRGAKKDIGGQLRLDAVSFHVFPTRVSFDAAYGFDVTPLQFAGEAEKRSGLKVYFSLLFGYL